LESGSLSRNVILCDAAGRPTGTADIHAAHSGEGMLHLAFSVYIFSPDGRRLLIQQRSGEKRLWPLAWANTCCSHPREDELLIEGGQRRLHEEMRIVCPLRLGPSFIYRAEDPAGRGVEHEYDMILIGTTSNEPKPDPAEVADWKWVEVESLLEDMRAHPEQYSPWLQQGLPLVLSFKARGGSP
jgi:isopentenyl-diphosphate delta-isomerase